MNLDWINYNRISAAQTFYKGRKYQNVELPWMASPNAIRATLPISTKMIETTTSGVLLDSPEQGFIQKVLDGKIEVGKFQATLPCFKMDGNLCKQSMEILLFWYAPNNIKECYEELIHDVLNCFFEISDIDEFDAVENGEGGHFININDAIVGNYGLRKMDDHVWLYGTGLKEPNFSIALSQRATHSHSHEEENHIHAVETT